jgi:hypothetical protein
LCSFDALCGSKIARGDDNVSRNQIALIRQLKVMREQKGLTYQNIVDACELAGEPVSMSSVRRIFTADDERAEEFRVSTLQAVARAVIGDGYNPDVTPPEDIAALRALLAVREDADRERQRGIDARSAQIDRMQTTIEEQQAEIKRKSKTIKIMILWAAAATVLLVLVAAGLIAYMIWDMLHPGIGAFE